METPFNPWNIERYDEFKELDEMMCQLQDMTVNNGGYFHFGLLRSTEGESLHLRLFNLFNEVPQHHDPYLTDSKTGERVYVAGRDPHNLKLTGIEKDALGQEILKTADHWAGYSGPYPERSTNDPGYDSFKKHLAERLISYLESRGIRKIARVSGVDTCYTFGQDHMNEDIVVDTADGIYVIHFGFSS